MVRGVQTTHSPTSPVGPPWFYPPAALWVPLAPPLYHPPVTLCGALCTTHRSPCGVPPPHPSATPVPPTGHPVGAPSPPLHPKP